MELARKVGRKVARGVKITTALREAGIVKQHQKEWRDKAAAGKKPYTTFMTFLDKKEAAAVSKSEEDVHEGRKNWCASARWLEARDKETWMRTHRQERATHARLELMFPDLAAGGAEAAKRLAAETAKRGCGSRRRSIGSPGRRRPGAA